PLKILLLHWFRQLDALPAFFGWSDVTRISSALLTGVVIQLVLYLFSGGMSEIAAPRSVIITDALLSACGLFALRYGLNWLSQGRLEFWQHNRDLEPVAVMGAGEAGATYVRLLRNERDCPLQPVCFLDDDPTMAGGFLSSLPIL